MIPLIGVVSFRNGQSHMFRTWIPLLLVWLIILARFPIALAADLYCVSRLPGKSLSRICGGVADSQRAAKD